MRETATNPSQATVVLVVTLKSTNLNQSIFGLELSFDKHTCTVHTRIYDPHTSVQITSDTQPVQTRSTKRSSKRRLYGPHTPIQITPDTQPVQSNVEHKEELKEATVRSTPAC